MSDELKAAVAVESSGNTDPRIECVVLRLEADCDFHDRFKGEDWSRTTYAMKRDIRAVLDALEEAKDETARAIIESVADHMMREAESRIPPTIDVPSIRRVAARLTND